MAAWRAVLLLKLVVALPRLLGWSPEEHFRRPAMDALSSGVESWWERRAVAAMDLEWLAGMER